jgi:hypothetical protein
LSWFIRTFKGRIVSHVHNPHSNLTSHWDLHDQGTSESISKHRVFYFTKAMRA